jgi:hypothetical protein
VRRNKRTGLGLRVATRAPLRSCPILTYLLIGVAQAHPGPTGGGRVWGRWTCRADLGEDDLSAAAVDAGDGRHKLNLGDTVSSGHQGFVAGSDLEPYANDCLGDDTQAGVVVACVSPHELVGLIHRDRVLIGGHSLGLFDNNP